MDRFVNANSIFQKLRTSSICVLLFVCAITGCTWGRKELSESPKRSSSIVAFPAKPSTIGALAKVPVAEITQLLDQRVPREFTAEGHGEDACTVIEAKAGPIVIGRAEICAGTTYEFTAARAAPIKVSTVGPETLRLTLPINFSGKGGLLGDEAKHVKVDAKTFKGGLEITADLKAQVSSDWCPQFDAKVSFNWTNNPKIEIVSGVWVDIKGQVEEKLNEKLPELVEKAKTAIDCKTFRQQISKIYGSRTFAVKLPNTPKAHLNLQPTGMGFSGLLMEPSIVILAALITANAEISANPLIPTVLPLPRVEKIPAATPHLNVALPLRAPYEALEKALTKSVGGRTFISDTPAGRVAITIKKIEIYPSDKQLVIGAMLKADLPNRRQDTSGTVYLFARPVVDETGVRISLGDVNFARKLDDDFWTAATALFETQIIKEIRKAASYDLTTDILKAKNMLSKKLRDPKTAPGMTVTAEDVSMRLGRVGVAEKELAIEGLFSAKVSIAVK